MTTGTSITVPLSAFAGELVKLGPKLRIALVRGMRDAGNVLRKEVRATIAETDPMPVDQGFYKTGWQKENIEAGCIVGNGMFYAQFIERGRLPGHGAPIEPIADWVRRKRLYLNVLAAHYAAQKTIRAGHDADSLAQARTIDKVRRKANIREAIDPFDIDSVTGKKRTPTEYATTKRKLGADLKRDVIEAACREVAMMVILKMWREGIKPKWPLRRAIDSANDEMHSRIWHALSEIKP